MARPRIAVALLAVTALVGGYLYWTHRPAEPSSARATGSITDERTTVATSGDVSLRLSRPELPEVGWESLGEWLKAGLFAGAPTEISSDAEGPEKYTITRTYQAPLPADAIASLVYFDEEADTWISVASTLAADRRSVSATVDHLSVWNDIVAFGTEAKDAAAGAVKAAWNGVVNVADKAKQAGQSVGEWLKQGVNEFSEAVFYTAAKTFEVRVDFPNCNAASPDWVLDEQVPEPYANGPIHWCVGRDKNDAETLEVKARVNRGYGFVYTPKAEATEMSLSNDEAGLFDTAADIVADLDAVISSSVQDLLSGSTLVGAGEELVLNFDEPPLSEAQAPQIELTRPEPGVFFATAAGQLLTAAGISKAEGKAASLVFLATCGRGLQEAQDIGAALAAGVACAQNHKARETMAKTLAEIIVTNDPKIATSTAASRAVRATNALSMAVLAMKPIISTASYAADAKAGGLLAVTLSIRSQQSRGQAMLGTEWFVHGGHFTIDESMSAESVHRGICQEADLDSTNWCNTYTEYNVDVHSWGLSLTVTKVYVKNETTGELYDSPADDEWLRPGEYLELRPFKDDSLVTARFLADGTEIEAPGNPYLCDVNGTYPFGLCGA